MPSLKEIANKTIKVRDLIGEANDHLSSARAHLDLIVWYSREGVQFVGTRVEHDAFVLSGE